MNWKPIAFAGLWLSLAAEAAPCGGQFNTANGLLSLEAVSVGGSRYQASLSLQGGLFQINQATLLQVADCSNPASYSDGLLYVPTVDVAGVSWNAQLQWQTGSNPLQFVLRSAGPNSSNAQVIGSAGLDAWDRLAQVDKNRVTTWNSLFVHQSVGQDLEGGCTSNGVKPEYFGPGNLIDSTNFYGGLFEGISNGDPVSKFNYFRTQVLANKDKLRLAIFKFGYADIEATTLSTVQAGYQAMVNDIRASGVRVMHITPPLVYDAAYNTPKMQMRDWMLTTFANDIIFDLQDIESKSDAIGSRCEQNGVWHICSDLRSTTSCPSNGQGIDTSSQGHLCAAAADKIAKAFLYSVYQAGK